MKVVNILIEFENIFQFINVRLGLGDVDQIFVLLGCIDDVCYFLMAWVIDSFLVPSVAHACARTKLILRTLGNLDKHKSYKRNNKIASLCLVLPMPGHRQSWSYQLGGNLDKH